MDICRIELHICIVADIVDLLVLRVKVRNLDEVVADHDMIVLIASHEAAQNDSAGQLARIREDSGLRSQDQRACIADAEILYLFDIDLRAGYIDHAVAAVLGLQRSFQEVGLADEVSDKFTLRMIVDLLR